MKSGYETVVWLAYTLVGLAVTVGAIAVTAAATGTFSIGDITDGGQFAVYTAAMLVGTLYVLNKPAVERLPWTEWFGLVTFVGLFGAAAVAVLTTLDANDVSRNGHKIDPAVFRWPSIGLFVVSVLVASIAMWLDNRRLEIDLGGRRRQAQQDLRSSFRETANTELEQTQ